MKTKRVIPLLLMFVMVLGCESETPIAPGSNSEQSLSEIATKAHNPADRSSSNVYTFADMTEVGTSNLVRKANGVSYNLQTSELEPGTVVTLWMVIFNNPENCSEDCGNDDLANLEANIDVVYASGRIIGESGKATYAGHRNEGDNSGSIFPAWLGLPNPGLVNAEKAEIHFVVHTHGPKIPELVNEMLHSFNAGCGPNFVEGLPPVPEELGTYGPNTCEDIQFAVHKP
ncbi:hypothetical protein [Fodinibius salsisoli]|uniref:Uncharacterized protein n=1 Tax=Fodinibius salsisoli TaxID=2820877 RepID=A0ABT3PQD2_9BACT|nr:hypothetical protein [Fodinibius salsisoli]MCW9708070.1 hypothetical protein [Fodinibius salsisoli]